MCLEACDYPAGNRKQLPYYRNPIVRYVIISYLSLAINMIHRSG